MKLEKVIRIAATFIAIAGLAVLAAGKAMFPMADGFTVMPMLIVYLMGIMMIWRPRTSNREDAHGHR